VVFAKRQGGRSQEQLEMQQAVDLEVKCPHPPLPTLRYTLWSSSAAPSGQATVFEAKFVSTILGISF
jgi:hypothetical protein